MGAQSKPTCVAAILVLAVALGPLLSCSAAPGTDSGKDSDTGLSVEQLLAFETDGDFSVTQSMDDLAGLSEVVISGHLRSVRPGRKVVTEMEGVSTILYTTVVASIEVDQAVKGPLKVGDTALIEVSFSALDDVRVERAADLATYTGSRVLIAAGRSTENFEPVNAVDGVGGTYYSALPQGLVVQEADVLVSLRFGGRYLSELNGIRTIDQLLDQTRNRSAPWTLPAPAEPTDAPAKD